MANHNSAKKRIRRNDKFQLINKVRKTRVDYCEVCECTPCDCDYGNDEENMWKMWGDI